jgi:hypothetical protein
MAMKPHKIFLFIALLIASCASKPAASASDPPSGKWSGDYGPDASRREPVAVDLQWEGGNLGGAVRIGVRSLPLTKASFTPATGAITLEFDAQGNGGQLVHYVIEGKVEGNMMTGNWHHDDVRGDFKVTKQ